MIFSTIFLNVIQSTSIVETRTIYGTDLLWTVIQLNVRKRWMNTKKTLNPHHKTILGFKQLLCSHQIHTDPMSFDSNVCLSHSGPLMLSIFAHQSVFFPSLPYLFLKIPHDSSTLWLQRETLLFKFGFMKTKHPLMNTCDCERLWQEKIMLKWKKTNKVAV